ncbi:MAG: Pycsar system effector family protein [Maribacter sp.]
MEIKKEEKIPKSEKKKAKVKEILDAKSLDTLYRTLSRNHYTLLRMVDNKASIILTVNSILITLIFGAMHLATGIDKYNIGIFISSIIYFLLISMIFALVGMLPHKYLGKQYKQSGYNGSLYAGNFASKSLTEFKSEFKRITKNGKTVFDEITTDIYFLGLAIKRKQTMIKGAVISLIIGLIWSVIYTAIQT